MKNKEILFIIPARKGSKGIANKNTKKLSGKPLIEYTLDFVKTISENDHKICVSTDDEKVEKIVRKYPKFDLIKRPRKFSTDNSSMYDVIMHALSFYSQKSIVFSSIILLQPTSPFRVKEDFFNILKSFESDIDMVVSVRISKENPYYLLYEEKDNGFLAKAKELKISRRQDVPKVYCLNGSFFMINVSSLYQKSIGEFSRIRKVEMPFERSIDIDDNNDWILAEFFLQNHKKNNFKI